MLLSEDRFGRIMVLHHFVNAYIYKIILKLENMPNLHK